jgi:endonuclease YncB( thermonuclease family)
MIVAGWMIIFVQGVSADEISGKPRVLDGDTLKFGDQSVRLYGIDTAEAGQTCKAKSGKRWKCADEAMDRLADLIADGVTCRGDERDTYGRLLGTCYTPEGADINKQLVAEGLAWAFRKYSDTYNAVEDEVRSKRIGIWQAETETPWDYRAAKWEVAEQESPEGCPIKGNINNKGEAIYHAPWSPWYKKTKVSVEKGERWFCDEAEAVTAGWRAPSWR